MVKKKNKSSLITHHPSPLKWAGGKYRLIDNIKRYLPKGNRLIEPFVGSGVVFLNTNYDSYLLADINGDLINVYYTLKEYGREFIEFTKSFFTPKNNTKEKYLELRDVFNSIDDAFLKSALFVYLNRHCYNGLVRYNSKGQFNTPFGKYKEVYFPDSDLIVKHVDRYEIIDVRRNISCKEREKVKEIIAVFGVDR